MAEFAKHHIHQNISKSLICRQCSNSLNVKLNCFKQIQDEIFEELCISDYRNVVKAENDYRNIFNKKLESNVLRKVVLPINISDVTNEFMIIGELSSLPHQNSSLRIINFLYDLMSESATVDHPICLNCTDSILDQMDSELENVKEEHKVYQKFLDNFKDNDETDLEELEAELSKLKATEVVLETRLQECETEVKNVKDMLKTCLKETEALEKKEKKEWFQHSSKKHELLALEDEERSVNNQLMYAQTQLNKLSNINVFNATFHIWYSGRFGIINNFRLGRLLGEPVEWAEINAAWGQTVLLLHSLAKKINFTFERYKLMPYGCQSYIIPLKSKNKVLPLYSLCDTKYVLDHQFDHAMCAFLDCLQQCKEKVEEGNNSFYLPYRIDTDKIEDTSAGKSYSIKIHLNSPEKWTKALKYMLTILKTLAWGSIQFQEDE